MILAIILNHGVMVMADGTIGVGIVSRVMATGVMVMANGYMEMGNGAMVIANVAMVMNDGAMMIANDDVDGDGDGDGDGSWCHVYGSRSHSDGYPSHGYWPLATQ